MVVDRRIDGVYVYINARAYADAAARDRQMDHEAKKWAAREIEAMTQKVRRNLTFIPKTDDK